MKSIGDILETFPNGMTFKDDVVIVQAVDSIKIVYRTTDKIRTSVTFIAEFIKTLQGGITPDRYAEIFSSDARIECLASLHSRNYLRSFTEGSCDRFSRQVAWQGNFTAVPYDAMNRLGAAKVMIVGCGGVGSIVASHLARSGVRNFCLIDYANVDLPDMNRQLTYFPKDIGKPKVDVLKQYLEENFEAVCHKEHLMVDQSNVLEKLCEDYRPDMIINGADEPIGKITTWIAHMSLKKKIPAMFGSLATEMGCVGPLLVSERAKVEYIESCTSFLGDVLSAKCTSSICFTNSSIAVKVAFEIYKFLSGIHSPSSLDTTLVYDLMEDRLVGDIKWGVEGE